MGEGCPTPIGRATLPRQRGDQRDQLRLAVHPGLGEDRAQLHFGGVVRDAQRLRRLDQRLPAGQRGGQPCLGGGQLEQIAQGLRVGAQRGAGARKEQRQRAGAGMDRRQVERPRGHHDIAVHRALDAKPGQRQRRIAAIEQPRHHLLVPAGGKDQFIAALAPVGNRAPQERPVHDRAVSAAFENHRDRPFKGEVLYHSV